MSRISVIEASPEVTAGIVRACDEAGHEVAVAAHGLDALEHLAAARPDLVILDVVDPERDGASLARIIRERPAFRQVPILAVVADTRRQDEVMLRAAGIDRFVFRPVSARELLRAVSALLGAGDRVPGLLEAYSAVQAMLTVPARKVPAAPERGFAGVGIWWTL